MHEGHWNAVLFDVEFESAAGVHAGLSFNLNYAAPELIAAQALGSSTFLSDPSADVWALGVTAFELLLGRKAVPTGVRLFLNILLQQTEKKCLLSFCCTFARPQALVGLAAHYLPPRTPRVYVQVPVSRKASRSCYW